MRRSTDCFSAFILYPFRRKGNNLAGWYKRFQRLSKQELSALGAKSSSFAPFIYNAHNFPFPNVAAVLCILRRTFSAEIKTGGIMPGAMYGSIPPARLRGTCKRPAHPDMRSPHGGMRLWYWPRNRRFWLALRIFRLSTPACKIKSINGAVHKSSALRM